MKNKIYFVPQTLFLLLLMAAVSRAQTCTFEAHQSPSLGEIDHETVWTDEGPRDRTTIYMTERVSLSLDQDSWDDPDRRVCTDGERMTSRTVFGDNPATPTWVASSDGEVMPTSGWETTLTANVAADDYNTTVTATIDDTPGGDDNELTRTVSFRVKKPILITQTVATTPADRTRKTIGIGEEVNISLKPAAIGALDWSITAGKGTGKVTPDNGKTTKLSAPDRAMAKTTVQAVRGALTFTVDFTVIEPAQGGVKFVKEMGVHVSGEAHAGLIVRPILITPTTVSFYNVKVREQTAVGVAKGTLAVNHAGGPPPGLNGTKHKLGNFKGLSQANVVAAPDIANSKFLTGMVNLAAPNLPGKNYNGSFTWEIPWEFKVGTGTPKKFDTLTQFITLSKTGKVFISKRNIDACFEILDPDSLPELE